MKQIAITCLALAPLLTGCAAGSFGPRLSADQKHQAKAVAGVRSEVRKLRRRLRSLKRQVNARQPSSTVVVGSSRKLEDVKKRLAALEAASRYSGPSGDGDQLVAGRLAKLEEKVKQLDGASKPATGTATEGKNPALETRLSKLETDLEKDRTLVIDFLEDLDKRIEDLEKSSPGGSPAVPPKP